MVVSTGSSLVLYKIFLFHSDSLYNLASFSNNRESCPFNEKIVVSDEQCCGFGIIALYCKLNLMKLKWQT